MYCVSTHYAWTEDKAIEIFNETYPNQRIISITEKYQVIPPTMCTNDDRKVQGTRTWITRYYIYQCQEINLDPATGEEVYIGMRFVTDAEAKLEAIKLAKEYTLQTQLPHTIRIVKVLESESNIVSNHWPKNGQASGWEFVYTDQDKDQDITVLSKVTINPAAQAGSYSSYSGVRLAYDTIQWFNTYGPTDILAIDGFKVTVQGLSTVIDINNLVRVNDQDLQEAV